jgi:phage/plasmid-like protein (TIGR03299 family)
MAHNIGQMFYFGERPWHKLGTKLDKPATIEEALSAGGLDWTVSMHPLVLAREHQSAVIQRQAIVRDDVLPGQPGRVLGVVHPNFKVLQNRDGAALFDSLFGKGEAVYHTGGYLKKGEVVWLMAKLPKSIVLPGEDKLDTYLLFSNSHDGTLPIDIRLTTVRVVCNNTLTLALRKKDQAHVFRRGHSGNYEVLKSDAEAFFQSILAQQDETQVVMAKLVQAKCSDDAFAAFLKVLLPDPTRPATANANKAVERGFDTRTATISEQRDQIMAVHLSGHKVPDQPKVVISPAEKNWWGGLNSITAWVDHVSEVDGDRYANAMFGGGDRLKTSAYQKILSAAGVVAKV